jgi:two-component system, OmpR family, response regulator MtrA
MASRGPIRVLVVEDQHLVVELVSLTLNHGAFVTREAQNAVEATALLADWQPELAVIDMDVGGDQLLQQIGGVGLRTGTRVPTIALTRRGDLKSKLAAFDQGVDDILTIPFSPEELLARALAVTRRAYGKTVPFQPVLHIGDLELDILNRIVRAGTSEIHLSGLEQALLYLLAAHAGEVLSRDEILDTLWGVDHVAESNIVDRHVRSLRGKLHDDWRRPRFIATVPGKGYRFVPVLDGAGDVPPRGRDDRSRAPAPRYASARPGLAARGRNRPRGR